MLRLSQHEVGDRQKSSQSAVITDTNHADAGMLHSEYVILQPRVSCFDTMWHLDTPLYTPTTEMLSLSVA